MHPKRSELENQLPFLIHATIGGEEHALDKNVQHTVDLDKEEKYIYGLAR
jgi:hypothetical protein